MVILVVEVKWVVGVKCVFWLNWSLGVKLVDVRRRNVAAVERNLEILSGPLRLPVLDSANYKYM